MSDCIVVGIGNEYRGDDGAGWAVIDGLKKELEGFSPIKLVKNRGDIAELIDIFSHYKTVYLVDACQTEAAVGSWHRINALTQPIQEKNPLTSTHGFSVIQAISLAKNLNQLPHTLILYVINGSHFTMNDMMSPPVAASVNLVIRALLNEKEILACMNTVS